MIMNDTQCIKSLEETCTYIYNSESGFDGTCVSKDITNFTCNDIKRNNQCCDGGNILSLNNKCGIYGSTCEKKCSILLSETDCDSRTNDCFWLLKDESEDNSFSSDGTCEDKV
jgi:hypothetical protein